ncbi:MAG TPA: hypothetical protein PK402_12520 [Tepidisphaeraceae bacterium]|nr:hypothetical protein [Tepidisphaeraceae bacterium]
MTALLLPSLGSSCVSDDGGSDSSRSEPDDWQNDRDDSDNESNPLAIPRQAQVLRDYPKGSFKWKSDTSGYVWIYDLEERESMERVEIRKGETLEVFPDENRIKIDGDTRSKANLHRDSRHRLYLLSDDRRYDRDQDDRDQTDRDNRNQNDREQTVNQPGSLRNTKLVKEAKGSSFEWKSPSRGRVVLFDARANSPVVEFKVNKNQKVEVDPKADRVKVDGKTVYDRNLESNGTYRLYFEAE